MKLYSIKNYSGQKTLIVNDIKNVDVLSLYKKAKSLDIPFAIKQEIGIQIWGASTVADYVGIKDVTKLLD